MTYAPFVRAGAGRHLAIDPDRLVEHVDPEGKSWEHITSPEHLACREHRRADLGPRTERARGTDVFVWARGEAPEPGLTQVGGTPYLAAGTEWPRFDGEPATFLAQFDFEDSKDLLPALPGNVLTIFVKDEDYVFGEPDQFRLLWQPAGLVDRIAPEDCPPPRLEFITAHGIRRRTVDDPGLYASEDEELDRDRTKANFYLPVAQATKIGGTIFDPQDIDPDVPDDVRLLCALSSIQAISERPWPFANEQEPLDDRFGERGRHHPRNQLMISDMGTLMFLLNDAGEIELYSGFY